ncbi:hypothetical protein M408DRAFT_173556 [Serendipita vermifera MAFF 305830]|uniref:Uncharacterized protein n=1 Tax=Serendipita vermifera MAFF 305830 TaxID=933852 RepID=A0A0C3B4L1_SERVB|nr:hypothetical protein M408DRAFT_173556 [Serendipita vermifera MAFF 305830]
MSLNEHEADLRQRDDIDKSLVPPNGPKLLSSCIGTSSTSLFSVQLRIMRLESIRITESKRH